MSLSVMEMEGKSFTSSDKRVAYCTKNSVHLHPLQKELQDKTISKMGGRAIMMGAPEAYQFCTNLIKVIGGKRCLDVGLFTGASALAWALAIPDDGEVISMDVNESSYEQVGKDIFERSPVKHKIKIKIQSAVKTLDELIEQGESEKFDFAFIDADKGNYPNYYEKCLTLLRPGGFIAIDNALMGGSVYGVDHPGWGPAETKIMDQLNEKIHMDDRVHSSLLGMADGIHLAFKK